MEVFGVAARFGKEIENRRRVHSTPELNSICSCSSYWNKKKKKSPLGFLHHSEDLNAESSLREIKSHCFLAVTIPLEGPDRR